MKVLAINCGSSSIRFSVTTTGPEPVNPQTLARGLIDGIGSPESSIRMSRPQRDAVHQRRAVPDHRRGIQTLFHLLEQDERLVPATLDAVGHRFVHGGGGATEPVVVDRPMESTLETLTDLAPIHNPAALGGIQESRAVLGERVPMVCVFDTAFHQSMPAVASTYAIPHILATRHHIKRYGFHGIAHASLLQGYVASRGAAHRQDRLITLHLGSGCSVTASEAGRSLDTSMGFTPLEGLVMGTRCGDLDPTLMNYLAGKERVSCAEVEQWFNHQSGLLGISGTSSDMRILLRAMHHDRDERATLAIDLFCYRARKYIGAYLAVLGGAEAIIFGGGIGESSPEIRARVCGNMAWCGLTLDDARNRRAVDLPPGAAACISADRAGLAAYVVAADEELHIARQTAECLTRTKHH